MRQVKQFTFNRIKYKIEYTGKIYGMTDRIDMDVVTPVMTIMDGDDFQAFHSALHESLEAARFPDSALHDRNGEPTTRDVARFLWVTWVNGSNK